MKPRRKEQVASRDPRIDPRPGDVVKLGHHGVYRVIANDARIVTDTPTDPQHSDFGEDLTNRLKQWRMWAMHGVVLQRAEDKQ